LTNQQYPIFYHRINPSGRCLAIAAWFGGYFFVDRVQFPEWIRKVRFHGFKRLPWNSRSFLIVAIIVPGYFLVASFFPLLPGEGRLRLIDSILCILFAAAAAAVWAFRTGTLRMTGRARADPRRNRDRIRDADSAGRR
jgi:hypothetical protein